MGMSIPLMVISIVLFFILFFGLGFILNMLFRKTWIMAVVYPIIALYITGDLRVSEYVTNFSSSMSFLWERVQSLAVADAVILLSGFVGSIVSGWVIRILRVRGYRMF
ncbi:membrane protein [Bacillus sp. FJAT-27916]|uniref:YuiB family protein n=1 Tax=Bacillus sp. FJAT-27916 TaxID=1679169 RepID=UPI000670CE7C|nr:YuiB family protein [Bacillus sp. FJAT-27916]KMY43298.1 membrane protein [Bacillus sp. FJAT-27916]